MYHPVWTVPSCRGRFPVCFEKKDHLCISSGKSRVQYVQLTEAPSRGNSSEPCLGHHCGYENLCQVLVHWHCCSKRIFEHFVLIVNEVGPFPVVPHQVVVGNIPIVPRLGLDWLKISIRGVNYSQMFGLVPYGMVDYLRIRSAWGRKTETLQRFSGLNAVSMNLLVLWL